ncbi:MAG: serine hydrolase domain-containing protein [Chloroflexota bacterium]
MFYLKTILTTGAAISLWIIFVGFGALSGWWNRPIASTGDTQQFMDAAVAIVDEESRGNVALVLIRDGEVFAEHYAGLEDEIDRNTLFQTASMSKWITAHAIMKLAQDGRLNLDQPVDDYLTRWQIPQSEFDTDKVTARLLLSHMSGLTDGLGFGDYGPEETVPTLEESLSQPRASGGREVEINLGIEPGTEFQYSGGGYLILELLVEEISGELFESYVKQKILAPSLMSRSTFEYIAGWDNVSSAYDADGQPAPLYQYAAAGATGFATSAEDMVRFVQSQLANEPLQQATITAMREPHARTLGADIWGLGTMLYAPTDSGAYVYGHDGQNDPAINASVRINPETGDAFIAFVSGGPALATSLGYEWVLWQTGRPDFLHSEAVIRDAIPMFLIGALLLIGLAIAAIWRYRTRSK